MNTEPDPRLDAHGNPLPLSPCPKCGSPNDAATSCDETDPEEKARPVPGDVTVCIRCAAILQFTETMAVKEVQLEELDADDDTKFQLRRLQQHVRRIDWKKE